MIAYDPRRIDPARRYVVRASIREGGHVIFTTDRAYAVLTHGHGVRVSILMHRVGVADAGEPARSRKFRGSNEFAAPAGLLNTRWRPTRIGGREVIVRKPESKPWIVLDRDSRRLTGTGSCNRISGEFQAGERTLRFARVIATRMA